MGLGVIYQFILAWRIKDKAMLILYLILIAIILLMSIKEPFFFKPAFSQLMAMVFFLAVQKEPGLVMAGNETPTGRLRKKKGENPFPCGGA
jgi:hypothetical protein